MTLLITTALPTVGKITNSNGSIETGQETTPFDPNLLKPTQSLRGYNIALINDDGYAPDVKTQLELWGATVDIINIPDITVALLSGYHVVWIPAESAKLIDDGGKDDEIRDYIFAGGGLIFTQPNVVGVYIPKCLPYTWEITDHWYGYPCAATIVDPTHELTQGLGSTYVLVLLIRFLHAHFVYLRAPFVRSIHQCVRQQQISGCHRCLLKTISSPRPLNPHT